jgi:uroporphyrinogen decarboxylase
VKTGNSVNSLQRVLTALSFKEADRVPFFLLLTTHGARELGLSIKDYFTNPEAVAEGQCRMRQRYGHDCVYAFTYASIETEAWGANVDFAADGPPNAASLVIHQPRDIDSLSVPDIHSTPCLERNLKAIRIMKARINDEAPIIGVVMSPFSLPVMQMGFSAYLDLLHEDRTRFNRLMETNTEFCISWANAQLDAGATAICYFDPVSSTDMIPIELYRELAYPVACRTIGDIHGPTATHFASGRSLGLVDLVAGTQTAMISISVSDDLAEAKKLCHDRLTVFGNLDGITMRRWTRDDAEREVRNAINAAAAGGGFILSDNHGEIHYSVDETILDSIAEAVHRWGCYPLTGST